MWPRPQGRKVRKPGFGPTPPFPNPLLFLPQPSPFPPHPGWDQAAPLGPWLALLASDFQKRAPHANGVQPGGQAQWQSSLLCARRWGFINLAEPMLSLGWSVSVRSAAEPCQPRPAPVPLAQLAATPGGSALVICFSDLMIKAQPNHSGHLVPTVYIYVQTCCTFLVPKVKKPRGLFAEGRSSEEKPSGSMFALAWENVPECFPVKALEAEVPWA